MAKACSFCGQEFRTKQERLVVHVAKEFADEAPSGIFHVDTCFENATAAHRAAYNRRGKS